MQIKAVNDHFRQQKEKYVVKFCHTMFEHLFMKTVKISCVRVFYFRICQLQS